MTPSTTSFRQPSPSARSRSCSIASSVPTATHLELRRRPADERRDDPELVGRLGRERRLGPRRRRRAPPATRAPLRPDERPRRRRPAPSRRRTRAARPPARRARRCTRPSGAAAACARSRAPTSSSASIRSRRRAASSKRSSRARRFSFARSFGKASSSVSHSTPCSARARELRAPAARQRPELGRLRGADDAVAAAAEIEVPVGPHRPRVRRRAQLADQAQLLERRLELRAGARATRPRSSAPSAASTAGRWRSERKYERSRARRSRARPT